MSIQQKKTGPLILLMVNMFIAMLGIGLIIPILPEFLKEFGAGGKTAGYLVAASGLTQFIFSPIVGELSDKYGRKKMIVAGLALFTLSQLLFAFAGEVWMLYLSRLLGGMGGAALIPPMMAFVADITTDEDRGKGMGMLGAAMSLGFVVGPGVGGFLSEVSLRTPLYVSAAVAAVALVLSSIILPETLSKERQLAARAVTAKKENIFKQFVFSAKAPYFVPLLLVFVLTLGLMNFEAIFPLYADASYNFSTKQISVVITVGALVGTVIQAMLIDKILRRFGEVKLISASFLAAAVCMVLLLLSSNFWYVLGISVLFFVFTAIMRPAINTLLSKMAGNEQGFVAGMNNAYMSVGNIVGPAIAGNLFDVHINIPYLFGACILIGGVVLSMIWASRRGVAPAVPAAVQE
ncbi:MFS transporter [Paenibacillus sp. F411]|uniref:MFS transporter n=1 Tax=Paenibacillus sp. F411 TaxID=2820239 RepID=UPI001AAF86AC|nr:MFS transporter [Paenibacillus sp. F411]MBO2944681.1 MFS transporter [Paenibacillus sp. F411]